MPVHAEDSSHHGVPGIAIVPQRIFKKGKLSSISLFDSPARVVTDESGVATFDWLPADTDSETSSWLPRRGTPRSVGQYSIHRCRLLRSSILKARERTSMKC